jgi:hypothetical protein
LSQSNHCSMNNMLLSWRLLHVHQVLFHRIPFYHTCIDISHSFLRAVLVLKWPNVHTSQYKWTVHKKGSSELGTRNTLPKKSPNKKVLCSPAADG